MKVISGLIKYSKKNFASGVNTVARNKLNIQSVCTPGNRADIPLSCFSRAENGDFILYRGLKTYFGKDYEKSVAAASGLTRKGVLKRYGSSKRKLVASYTGLTQHGDPILHTTTKRKIARTFAGENGVIVVYRVPKEYIERAGFLGHIDENEISFFHSIPKKFVQKVLHTKPTKQVEQTGLLGQLPKSINIQI